MQWAKRSRPGHVRLKEVSVFGTDILDRTGSDQWSQVKGANDQFSRRGWASSEDAELFRDKSSSLKPNYFLQLFLRGLEGGSALKNREPLLFAGERSGRQSYCSIEHVTDRNPSLNFSPPLKAALPVLGLWLALHQNQSKKESMKLPFHRRLIYT